MRCGQDPADQANCPLSFKEADLAEKIKTAQQAVGIELAPEQEKAVEQAAHSGVLVITGGPGTGKTTVVKAIIQLLTSLGLKVRLAAPTGRAAKRLSEGYWQACQNHSPSFGVFLSGGRRFAFCPQ